MPTEGSIRLKLNYFSDGIFIAVFNAREADCEKARKSFIKRYGKAEWRTLQNRMTTGIMEIFQHSCDQVARWYIFKLARYSDDSACGRIA